MKTSVCIDAVFRGVDMVDAVRQVKSAGVDTIEFWCWWEKHNLEQVRACCDELGVEIYAMCTPFVSLCNPSLRQTFLDRLDESLMLCRKMRVPNVIAQVGADTGEDRAEQTGSIIAGLNAARELCSAAGVTCLVEPLNQHDHAGCFLSHAAEAFDIVRQVDSPYIKVLYDIYHQQRTEGEVIPTMLQNLQYIGHLHAAGAPMRQEPYRGEPDYKQVVRALEQSGYTGFFGLEYFPSVDVCESLSKTLAFLQLI